MNEKLIDQEVNIVHCPHDGELMVYEIKKIEIRYQGLTKTINMPGWYCPLCGEGIHSGKELEISDNALTELKNIFNNNMR